MSRATGLARTQNCSTAVLGDSLAAQNAILENPWPEVFRQTMGGLDSNVLMFNCSVDGNSFYRANTNVVSNGLTATQACVARGPQLVLVNLGYNDAVTNIDSRSLVQIEADALATFTALAAIPGVTIVYVSELIYDSSNFTPATCQNKGIIPYWWNLNGAAPITGYYSSEITGNAIAAAVQTALANWVSLDTYIRGLSQVNATITQNFFKVYRLGLSQVDGLHPAQLAAQLLSAYVIKGLKGQSFFSGLFPEFIDQTAYGGAGLIDPDSYFSDCLSVSGTGYVQNVTVEGERVSRQMLPYERNAVVNWFMPYKTTFNHTPLSAAADLSQNIVNTVQNGPPGATISISVDGAGFSSLGVATDDRGNFINTGSTWSAIGGLLGGSGAHTLRYAIGTEAYGPFSITNSAAANPIFLARTNTATAMTNATDVLVAWSSVVQDNVGGFSSNVWTVPTNSPGRYTIGWVIRATAAASTDVFGSELYINGVRTYDGSTMAANGGTTGLASSGCITLDLAGGASIAVYGRSATATSIPITTTLSNNWWSIVRVG